LNNLPYLPRHIATPTALLRSGSPQSWQQTNTTQDHRNALNHTPHTLRAGTGQSLSTSFIVWKIKKHIIMSISDQLATFTPSPLQTINESVIICPDSPAMNDENCPRQRRRSMARFKLKGPLKNANLQAECEALHTKAVDTQALLGTKMRLWLQTRPDTAAAFSGAGLEQFFSSYPKQRHVVQSTPGILAAAIAETAGIEVMVDPAMGKRWLRLEKAYRRTAPTVASGPARRSVGFAPSNTA